MSGTAPRGDTRVGSGGGSRSLYSVSGPPGSGTSTASVLLAELLACQRVDAGTLFRQMAVDAGATLEDFARMAERDHRIDLELDARMIEIARTSDRCMVLEGRLTGVLLRREGIQSFSTWIDAPEDIRTARIAGRDGLPFDTALRRLRSREGSERRRYMNIYGVNHDNLSLYDLVLDSSRLSPEEIVASIVATSERERGAL